LSSTARARCSWAGRPSSPGRGKGRGDRVEGTTGCEGMLSHAAGCGARVFLGAAPHSHARRRLSPSIGRGRQTSSRTPFNSRASPIATSHTQRPRPPQAGRVRGHQVPADHRVRHEEGV
jgi:hypothetical protein